MVQYGAGTQDEQNFHCGEGMSEDVTKQHSLLCRYVDWSVKCWAGVFRLSDALGSFPCTRKRFPCHIKPGMVARDCHYRTQEAEAGGF